MQSQHPKNCGANGRPALLKEPDTRNKERVRIYNCFPVLVTYNYILINSLFRSQRFCTLESGSETDWFKNVSFGL